MADARPRGENDEGVVEHNAPKARGRSYRTTISYQYAIDRIRRSPIFTRVASTAIIYQNANPFIYVQYLCQEFTNTMLSVTQPCHDPPKSTRISDVDTVIACEASSFDWVLFTNHHSAADACLNLHDPGASRCLVIRHPGLRRELPQHDQEPFLQSTGKLQFVLDDWGMVLRDPGWKMQLWRLEVRAKR